MEVPNKWRGAKTNSGEPVFGTLTKSSYWYAIANKDGIFKVFSNSLAKLAGYDAEGNEVYRSCKQ